MHRSVKDGLPIHHHGSDPFFPEYNAFQVYGLDLATLDVIYADRRTTQPTRDSTAQPMVSKPRPRLPLETSRVSATVM